MVQVAATGDYERDGFVILRAPLIPPSTIDKANADIDRVLAEQEQSLHPSIAEGGTVVLSKSSDDLVACAGVRELLRHPALEEWARKVTGATRPRVRTPSSPHPTPPRPSTHCLRTTAAGVVGAVLRQKPAGGGRWGYRAPSGAQTARSGHALPCPTSPME